MVLTERGAALAPVVSRVLEGISSLTDPLERFDPAVSSRFVRVAATNCFGPFFLPRVTDLVLQAGPQMSIEYCAMADHGTTLRPRSRGGRDRPRHRQLALAFGNAALCTAAHYGIRLPRPARSSAGRPGPAFDMQNLPDARAPFAIAARQRGRESRGRAPEGAATCTGASWFRFPNIRWRPRSCRAAIFASRQVVPLPSTWRARCR